MNTVGDAGVFFSYPHDIPCSNFFFISFFAYLDMATGYILMLLQSMNGRGFPWKDGRILAQRGDIYLSLIVNGIFLSSGR